MPREPDHAHVVAEVLAAELCPDAGALGQRQDLRLEPAIANALLGNTTTVPQIWPGDRFDLVWVFTLTTATGTYAFAQVPQLLLSGDQVTQIA